MDNNNKLVLFLFFLVFYTTSSVAAFDVSSRFFLKNFESLQRASQNIRTQSIMMNMERQINASQYKTLKNFPKSAVFNAPVPVTATASTSRALTIPKATLGSSARRMALAGSRLGLYGAAFQAAILAGEYLLEEYSDQELLNDPSIIEGDYKSIKERVEEDITSYTLNTTQVTSSSKRTACESGIGETISSLYYYDPTISEDNCGYKTPNGQLYPTILALTISTVPSVSFDPVSDDDLYDDLLDDLTDDEFDDFLNDPSVLPDLESNPQYDIQDADLNSDFDRSTDFYNDGTPIASTQPFQNGLTDPDLITLSVPEYDGTSITTIEGSVAGGHITTTDTVTESTFDLVNFTETQTTTITTTTVKVDTGTVVDSYTETKVRTIPRPDLNPSFNPDFDPNASPEPTPPIDPDGTTTTSGRDPNSPQKVEVVNFPPSLTDPSSTPPVDPCEGNETKLGCLEVGDNLPEPPPVAEYEVPFEVNPFALSGVAECPPPILLTLLIDDHTYEFSYQALCDFATMLNPVIVSLGFLLSFMIVANTIRHDN